MYAYDDTLSLLFFLIFDDVINLFNFSRLVFLSGLDGSCIQGESLTNMGPKRPQKNLPCSVGLRFF